MLKVLIVDDEKNICLMIQKMIDWESKDMEVVAIANNGKDAYEYIKTLKPDVVISDIRMPGFDGLNLVKMTLSEGIDISYIIISGYKYFEYAHTALKLGVEHYLLKPIDRNELEAVLDKISDEREVKLEERSSEDLSEEVKKSNKKIKKHFLTSIINQNELIKNMEMNQLNEEYQLNFHGSKYLALFVKIDFDQEMNWDLKSLLNIMDDIIEKEFQRAKIEFVNSPIRSGIISIINYDLDDNMIETVLVSMMNRIRFELDKFNAFSATIGIGRVKTDFEQVSDSIKEAIYTIKCRSKYGVNTIAYYENLKYNDISIETIFSEKDRQHFENAAEAMDISKIHNEVDEIILKIKLNTFYSPVIIYDVFEVISDIMIYIFKKNGTSDEYISIFKEEVEVASDSVVREETLVNRYKSAITLLFDNAIKEKKNQNTLPIRQAKLYIQENYMKQISQEDVATAIHLSASYLSTMFKKEIGINFSDYLTACRMEAAKKYLKESEFSINEVSEKVGYADSKYFSKIFHKNVGLKPSVYRKLYS